MLKTKSIKENKVGLALGGGAVLGAAHIGVLKALDELEISIGWISGTSIGALVACLFAFGKDESKVMDLAIDLSWRDIAGISFSKYGLFSNEKIETFLIENIGDVTFDQANIPLAIVATDITTGEKVIFREGNVAQAVMASTCIPGIFQPVEVDGRLLVDGGIAENIPVSPLKEMGVDLIIAVDLNAKHDYGKPNNIVGVLLNSFHYALINSAKLQTARANIHIKPDLSSFNRMKLSQTEDLIEKGYNETMKHLSELS